MNRRTLIVAVLVAFALALFGSVLLTEQLKPKHAHRPTVEPRPMGLVRTRDVHESNEYLFDTAYETCGALGLPRLARQYALPAKALIVARAYANQFEAAMRPGTYRGCLKALRESPDRTNES